MHLVGFAIETEMKASSLITGNKFHFQILLQLEVTDRWSVGRKQGHRNLLSDLSSHLQLLSPIRYLHRRETNIMACSKCQLRFLKVGSTDETTWFLRISVAHFRELHL